MHIATFSYVHKCHKEHSSRNCHNTKNCMATTLSPPKIFGSFSASVIMNSSYIMKVIIIAKDVWSGRHPHDHETAVTSICCLTKIKYDFFSSLYGYSMGIQSFLFSE